MASGLRSIYLFLVLTPLSHGQSSNATLMKHTAAPSTPSYMVQLQPATTSISHGPSTGYSKSKIPNSQPLIAPTPSHKIKSHAPPFTSQATNLLSQSVSKTVIKKTLIIDVSTTFFSKDIFPTLHASNLQTLVSSGSTMPGKVLATSGVQQVIRSQQSSLIVTSEIHSKILFVRTLHPTSSTVAKPVATQTHNHSSMPPILSTTSSDNISDVKPRPSKFEVIPSSSGMLKPSSSLAMQKPSASPAIPMLTLFSVMPNIYSTSIHPTSAMLNPSLTLVLPNHTTTAVVQNSTSSPVVPTSIQIMQNSTYTVLNPTTATHGQTASPATRKLASELANITSTFNVVTFSTTTVLLKLTTSPAIQKPTPSPVSWNLTSLNRSSTPAMPKPTSNPPSLSLTVSPMSTLVTQSVVTPVHLNLTNQSMTGVSSIFPTSGPFNHTTVPANTKEKTHTTLIVGLAVGLSLGMVLVIVVIVCYRRKRSSYQYNVFYDEQNIVMHPFDYSK